MRDSLPPTDDTMPAHRADAGDEGTMIMADQPLEDDASITGRAANGEGDEPEIELFPQGSVQGDGKSLKSLIKPGHSVQPTVSLMSAEVPISTGGLLDPEREGMLLVTYELAKLEPVPVREGDRGDRKIVGWKIRQQLRPVYIEPVQGEAGTIEAAFAALADASPKDAGALLDRLHTRMSDVLATA